MEGEGLARSRRVAVSTPGTYGISAGAQHLASGSSAKIKLTTKQVLLPTKAVAKAAVKAAPLQWLRCSRGRLSGCPRVQEGKSLKKKGKEGKGVIPEGEGTGAEPKEVDPEMAVVVKGLMAAKAAAAKWKKKSKYRCVAASCSLRPASLPTWHSVWAVQCAERELAFAAVTL